jgi:histidinol-phosphate aminotransferase
MVVSHSQKEKKYLYKELKRLGLSFSESATNFILVDFKRDTKKLYDYLLKNGVIIRSLAGWGLKDFFRVTVGLHKENEKFVKYIRDYLKGK